MFILIHKHLISILISGSATAKAEDTLRELWSLKLGNNELEPLITRVTDRS